MSDPYGYDPDRHLVDARPTGPIPGQEALEFPPPAPPEPEPRDIDALFERFNAAHPEVYDELLAMARRAVAAGRTRIGMKMLFEVVRWNRTVGGAEEGFKLNNVLTSRYARALMADHPELDGLFETRSSPGTGR